MATYAIPGFDSVIGAPVLSPGDVVILRASFVELYVGTGYTDEGMQWLVDNYGAVGFFNLMADPTEYTVNIQSPDYFGGLAPTP